MFAMSTSADSLTYHESTHIIHRELKCTNLLALIVTVTLLAGSRINLGIVCHQGIEWVLKNVVFERNISGTN